MSVWKRVSVGAHDPGGKTESMVGFKNIYLLIFIQWFIVTVFEKWQWQSGHSAENIKLGIWHQQHSQIWKLFLTMHHYRGYEVCMEAILWPYWIFGWQFWKDKAKTMSIEECFFLSILFTYSFQSIVQKLNTISM